jgi:lantibiotic transport system ATP-binding protein
MEFPIEAREVWKTYGATVAVCGLNLRVPPQSVYAFLGPNGAGKSTTIRMILGLQKPSRGTVCLFGSPSSVPQLTALRRVGALVEYPSLYLHLSGRENLEVHRRLLGLSPSSIDRALETVDLTSADRCLARSYSSGMKQRLGLALALLSNPDLLMLDEPTNELDPAGIHEVRALVRDLPRRCGATVFLSSHLLSEVEQVATHLAIISQGRLRFEGTREELQKRSKPAIRVEVDQPERAQALLAAVGAAVTREGNLLRIHPDFAPEASRVNALLVKAGVTVSQLTTQHPTLEDIFLELTSGSMAYKEGAIQ